MGRFERQICFHESLATRLISCSGQPQGECWCVLVGVMIIQYVLKGCLVRTVVLAPAFPGSSSLASMGKKVLGLMELRSDPMIDFLMSCKDYVLSKRRAKSSAICRNSVAIVQEGLSMQVRAEEVHLAQDL